ncbi:MAG: AAA family ATPase, partial [Nanoarchaeota archaeon]|nr:AAA family ATPase [Nanoarchaeota archaeon]
MKFKRFYTNKKNFDVKFKNGLNLIYSEVKNKKTEHGSGKSTFFKLIDYCLLAKPDDKFLDEENFKDIELYLELEFENYSSVIINRNFKDLDNIKISFEGKEFETKTNDEAKDLFRELFFGFKKEDSTHLSFRQLISFLFRFENDYDDSFM